MQSREVIAKARFAMLVNAHPHDLVLIAHTGAEQTTYSLQVLRRDAEGKQWTVPVGELYTDGEVEE